MQNKYSTGLQKDDCFELHHEAARDLFKYIKNLETSSEVSLKRPEVVDNLEKFTIGCWLDANNIVKTKDGKNQ